MSAGTFAFACVRVALVLGSAGVAGHRITKALGYRSDAVGRLAAIVTSLSLVLVCAEALGIVGELRTGPCIGLLVVVAAAASVWEARARTATEAPIADSAPQRTAGSARAADTPPHPGAGACSR